MRRNFWRNVLYLFVCGFLVLANTGTALAAEETPAVPTQPNEADDGALEVGVWYINDYENCPGAGLGDLGLTDNDALSLRNRLTATYYVWPFTYPGARWSAPYVYGNGSAWEEDWKRAASGGTEESYIDNVDLAYFSGHGSANGFFFGVGGNKHDDCILTAEEVQGAWGTKDNDWIGLSACNVLDDPVSNLQRWARAMNGTRLLMGFKTVMADVDFGNELGWHIRWNKTMPQAWFYSVDTLLPGSQIARILAGDPAYWNDRWNNHASATVVDNIFFWWTHQAGTPLATVSAASVNRVDRLMALGAEMPIYKTAPLGLAEATAKYAGIGAAFGLTDTTPISGVTAADIFGPLAGEDQIFVSDNGDLTMDASAGNYIYIDSTQLWNGDAALRSALQAASGDSVLAIDSDGAKAIAEQFLDQNNLMDPGAVFSSVAEDSIEGGTQAETAVNSASLSAIEQLLLEGPVTTNYKVNYSRVISYTPQVAGAAVAAPFNFDVVGPGPKLAVYVASTIPASVTAASMVEEAVIGGQGGWRTLQPVLAADNSQITVSMLPTETAKTLYRELGDRVTLDYTPVVAAQKEIIDFDAGYYEGPIGMNMDQLIPVYIATVKATLADNSTQEYTEHIPVNPLYMAPYADIIPPAGVESAVPGTKITLNAADASKKLSELGYSAALNFALGTGNPDSYTYDWYTNEITPTAKLTPVAGTGGKQIEFTVPSAAGDDKPAEVKIILVVTDSLKDGEPKIAKDTLVLSFRNLFLPVISR